MIEKLYTPGGSGNEFRIITKINEIIEHLNELEKLQFPFPPVVMLTSAVGKEQDDLSKM